jgi:hypothetical protein
MGNPPNRHWSTRHYYVDEAGDATLFDRKGRIIIGSEGCSRFFILGLLDVPNHKALALDLDDLRKRMIADPYFSGVPSMQGAAKKTALSFHAKDDLPEVRREVFSLLTKHELGFFAVVRDKWKVLEYVRQRNEADQSYRYNPTELYDFLVRSLFRDRLHKEDEYAIHFARRGKSDRTTALREALESARRRFNERWGIASTARIKVVPSTPQEETGLQAVDYFLWSLQRLYERKEDRFLGLLWQAFKLVRDLDETSKHRYGEYYTQKKPLTLAALNREPGI